MAVGNQVHNPQEKLPADFVRRVVVQFRRGVQLPYSSTAAAEVAKHAGRAWDDLISSFPGVTLVPYFSTIEESKLQDSMRLWSQGKDEMDPPRLTSYYAIECPRDIDPESVARTIGTWPSVEIAYPEAISVPASLNPSDDPRNIKQGYLNAAPDGIDARWAWQLGIDGSGISFVDIERGWTLDHEDLAAAAVTVISGVNENNNETRQHGTNVLGVVLAVDNDLGGIGIAPKVDNPRVSSACRSEGPPLDCNIGQSIAEATVAMKFGDVLLIELAKDMHFANPNEPWHYPVEIEKAVFDLIRIATRKGIIVIEAAGNGRSTPAGPKGNNLDTIPDDVPFLGMSRKFLDRSSPDFRDSGAIMVAAASTGVPHHRRYFSNYGSRIDCFAWGVGIDTCGGSDGGIHTYRTDFAGTSGASAIIAGAALIIQSWKIANCTLPYSALRLRRILGSRDLNTHSVGDDIGVMPNLRAIIESEPALQRPFIQEVHYERIGPSFQDQRISFDWWGPSEEVDDAQMASQTCWQNTRELFNLINYERKNHGCQELTYSSDLQAAAQKNSNKMAENAQMSHTGDLRAVLISLSGGYPFFWGALAENIRQFDQTPDEVMYGHGWMSSNLDHDNIVNPIFTHASVGCAVSRTNVPYWTLVLAQFI